MILVHLGKLWKSMVKINCANWYSNRNITFCGLLNACRKWELIQTLFWFTQSLLKTSMDLPDLCHISTRTFLVRSTANGTLRCSILHQYVMGVIKKYYNNTDVIYLSIEVGSFTYELQASPWWDGVSQIYPIPMSASDNWLFEKSDRYSIILK